jgi:hypothetical protein
MSRFLYLKFGFKHFWSNKIGGKAALKMLATTTGLGYVDSVCGTLQYRIAISEYYYDDMTSAEVFSFSIFKRF